MAQSRLCWQKTQNPPTVTEAADVRAVYDLVKNNS